VAAPSLTQELPSLTEKRCETLFSGTGFCVIRSGKLAIIYRHPKSQQQKKFRERRCRTRRENLSLLMNGNNGALFVLVTLLVHLSRESRAPLFHLSFEFVSGEKATHPPRRATRKRRILVPLDF
jgi:hypothetical protein